MALDIEKFVTHLRANAGKYSKGKCAKYVRLALRAGGSIVPEQPGHAKDYGPVLRRMGFSELAVENSATYRFIKGDIVVIQPYLDQRKSGHIAAFDGRIWISDFIQKDFWSGSGYRTHRPSHAFYRP